VWRRIAVPAAPARVQRAEVGVHGSGRGARGGIAGGRRSSCLCPQAEEQPVVEPGMGRTRPQHRDQRAHPRAQVKQLIPVPVVAMLTSPQDLLVGSISCTHGNLMLPIFSLGKYIVPGA
jgi:hypothetical protein